MILKLKNYRKDNILSNYALDKRIFSKNYMLLLWRVSKKIFLEYINFLYIFYVFNFIMRENYYINTCSIIQERSIREVGERRLIQIDSSTASYLYKLNKLLFIVEKDE